MSAERPLPPSLRIGLSTLAEAAGASCAVLFAPKPVGLALVTQIEMDQRAWEISHGLWASRREQLEAGNILRYKPTLLWPIFDSGTLAGLVYLDSAPDDFPDERSREDAALLATRMAAARTAITLNSYLTTRLLSPKALEEFKRDQTVVSLVFAGGNVSAAARQLGLSRQAFHARVMRLGIDPEVFKPRRREQ